MTQMNLQWRKLAEYVGRFTLGTIARLQRRNEIITSKLEFSMRYEIAICSIIIVTGTILMNWYTVYYDDCKEWWRFKI